MSYNPFDALKAVEPQRPDDEAEEEKQQLTKLERMDQEARELGFLVPIPDTGELYSRQVSPVSMVCIERVNGRYELHKIRWNKTGTIEDEKKLAAGSWRNVIKRAEKYLEWWDRQSFF